MDIETNSSALPATPAPAAEIPPPAPARGNFLQRNSLWLAGILNLIGDVGFLGNGIKTGDTYKKFGGGMYTLGGLNLALFGRVKPEENLREITESTAEFLKQKTGGLPEGSELAGVAAHKDAAQNGQFFYRNAAQNTLYGYTMGAGAMLASGIKKHRAGLGSAGLYYGISSLVFKLASLVIPEKALKDDGEKKSKGFIGWIREKPLRVFGYGSMVTDSLLALDTYQDFRRNPQKSGYAWTGVTAVTYILADLMMAISNKDPANAGGKLNTEEQQRVERLAADAIAREPREAQAALVREVAEFLAAQPQIAGKADAIAASIAQQAAQMDSPAWASRVKTDEPALQPIR
jgi:hypothetical protein